MQNIKIDKILIETVKQVKRGEVDYKALLGAYDEEGKLLMEIQRVLIEELAEGEREPLRDIEAQDITEYTDIIGVLVIKAIKSKPLRDAIKQLN